MVVVVIVVVVVVIVAELLSMIVKFGLLYPTVCYNKCSYIICATVQSAYVRTYNRKLLYLQTVYFTAMVHMIVFVNS